MITPFRFFLRHFSIYYLGSILLLFLAHSRAAEPGGRGPTVLGNGQVPQDARFAPVKDLDGYFPFQPAKNREDWERRAERVRQQILVSQGLWPMPTRTPLNPVIYGRIQRPGYTVEKVFFESIPGFFVTGNLYRPEKSQGKMPGVLCPHGHWQDGRFTDAGPTEIRKQIIDGAERFEEGGRSPLQARSMQLARMGMTVFHYDMIGYADSQQIPMEIAHGFSKQRPELNRTDHWGLFSPQAEAHLQSVMGLQTWNSIRALDFLASLPEVDTNRIAVTGASGGGTQTFILGAVDPRPAVIFPAVMVSTAMQGGCTCENASGLRIGTGNVEFAALFAPKPLGLTAANDWTREMTTKGFPELKQHYAMMGAPDNVMLKSAVHFPHNYNYVSRAALYSWLNKHFKLGQEDPILEEDFPRLTREQMSVWDTDHPRPAGGPEFEQKLLHWLTKDSETQIAKQFPGLAAPALHALLGRSLAEAGETAFTQTRKDDRRDYVEMPGLLRNKTYQEELAAVVLQPPNWRGQTVIWIDGRGKDGLYSAPGEIRPEVRQLLKAGKAVAGIDLLFQGESHGTEAAPQKNRRVRNPRQFAGYTYGYNDPLFAQRVHDILTFVQYLRSDEGKAGQIDMIGLNGAGPLVAAACTQTARGVQRAAIDTGGFRFGKLLDFEDANFLHGGAKFGDLPGMLRLSNAALWIAGENQQNPDLRELATRPGDRPIFFAGGAEQVARAAVDWLLAGQRPN